MTPQEQELLSNLSQKINQTQLQEKDPEAEDFLQKELGSNRDALYILAQTVLVQNIALEQAKAQVAQLQQQLQQAQQARPQPAHASSFLGRLLGEKDPQPTPAQGQGWGGQQPPPYQPVPQYSQPQAPPYGQAQYAPPAPPQYAPQPQYAPVQSGGSSFLRSAAQTAAGVAAGALAFEGVESILHGFGHGGYSPGLMGMGMGPGIGFGGGGFERPVEETVINNYYDEPGGGERRFEPGGEHHLHESGASFSNADYRTSGGGDVSSGDDQMGYDDSSSGDSGGYDNSGSDDSSGFDDGGGGSDNSGGDVL